MTCKEYLPIMWQVLNHFEVKPRNLKVRVKPAKRGGRCRHSGMYDFIVTLPQWLCKYDRYYAIYYVIHETCHIVRIMLKDDLGAHDEYFERVEDEALALWRIRIVRNKAYPKELYVDEQRIYNIN